MDLRLEDLYIARQQRTITKQKQKKATTFPTGNFLICTFEFYGKVSLTLPKKKKNNNSQRRKKKR
jgi:hypothetical protein